MTLKLQALKEGGFYPIKGECLVKMRQLATPVLRQAFLTVNGLHFDEAYREIKNDRELDFSRGKLPGRERL